MQFYTFFFIHDMCYGLNGFPHPPRPNPYVGALILNMMALEVVAFGVNQGEFRLCELGPYVGINATAGCCKLDIYKSEVTHQNATKLAP